ncbi:MAG: ArnT family glycosyltransferase [Anaerolineae bacterium]
MNRCPDRWIAFTLCALLFSLYLLSFSGVYHSSDEMSMLAVTDSLARRGQWDTEWIRWMGEQQGSWGPDGHLYSRKGIGMTLAALPFFWLALQSAHLGNVQTAMLTNAFVTALTGLLVYRFLRRLGYSPGVALGIALAFGLGTMAWPYARYLFSESLSGLGLMMSAYFLRGFQQQTGPGRAVLYGTRLGVAVLARLNNAIAVPLLGLALLIDLARSRPPGRRSWLKPIVWFLLPIGVALVISGWYNWIRFGNPLTTGYLPEERFVTPFFEGVYGLTLSPGKGLLWYNPLLFAALAGWLAFFRRHRREAVLSGALVLSQVAFYAPWYLWWAGHSWGPRFLVTILPFAVLSLAPALEAAFHRRMPAIAFALLATLSLGVQLLAVAVNFNLYLEEIYSRLGLYHPATLFDPAYSPLLRQIAYLRLQNLDLAWARHGVIHWPALLVGIVVVSLSAVALQVALRRRLPVWAGLGLGGALLAASLVSLRWYAPRGDAADAARLLHTMERPGEIAILTTPGLTEAFQDAYDGRLPIWGGASKELVGEQDRALWVCGRGDVEPAPVRFQVGDIWLIYFPSADSPFDPARLPARLLGRRPRLGEAIELMAVQVEGTPIRRGEVLSVSLYWRVLAPMDRSYTVFVQAIDEQGVKAGQVDRLPCAGGCPTTTWQTGDLIGERYDLPIHPAASPGSYRLITGMYDLTTGTNLSWFDSQGNPLGLVLLLGTVQVRP